jgi:hypothetical protein
LQARVWGFESPLFHVIFNFEFNLIFSIFDININDMKINGKNFIAFNLHELDKRNIIDSYVNEQYSDYKAILENRAKLAIDALGSNAPDEFNDYVKEELKKYTSERSEIIKNYLTETDKNYLLTKTAVDTINNIKFTNSEELRNLILDNYDEPSTLLIDKHSFIRFHKDVDGGIACIHLKLMPSNTPIPEHMVESVMAEMKRINYPVERANSYCTYEAFKIRIDGIRHPKYLQGESVPEIDFFIKAMIFIKCTNTEIELLENKPNGKKRVKVDNEKYLLDTNKDVVLVNSKYNKLVLRTEKFWVNPHGRFQRYGEGNKLVKYIIIDGYYKKGYKREYK